MLINGLRFDLLCDHCFSLVSSLRVELSMFILERDKTMTVDLSKYLTILIRQSSAQEMLGLSRSRIIGESEYYQIRKKSEFFVAEVRPCVNRPRTEAQSIRFQQQISRSRATQKKQSFVEIIKFW